MLKSYEAIYDHGRVEWLTEAPKPERFRMLVLIEQAELSGGDQAADAVLAESFGAWGQRSVADVDAMIESWRRLDWGAR